MFMECQFPKNVGYGAIGGSGWSTRLVRSDAGFEYRQQLWTYTINDGTPAQQTFGRPRGSWTVGHNLKYPAEWALLINFHRVAQGRLNGFRFQDYSDYTDETAPQSGVNAGVIAYNTLGVKQLYKAYSFNDDFGNTYTVLRPIYKPQPGTIVIYCEDGSVRSPITVDYATGVVTGQTVFGDYWKGQFDVPVRFDVDQYDISVDFPASAPGSTQPGGAGWRGIPLIELQMQDSAT